jgi:hypothetical protein
VRQDAARWGSNSRDPVLLGLQRKVREGGTLDAGDVAEWRASALARDFSPSLERQRVFTRRRPGDDQEIVVEITPGEVNRLDLALSTR